MTFMYQSGEQIRSGDRIEYAGAPGVVEFVVTGGSDDPSMNWYIERFAMAHMDAPTQSDCADRHSLP
jgi:hypothetical protein